MDYDPKKYDQKASDSIGPAGKLIDQLEQTLSSVGKSKNDSLVIIDIGCGPGNTLQLIKQRFVNSTLIGLDIDPSMIEYGNEQSKKAGTYDRLKFYTQNVEKPWAEWDELLHKLEGKVDAIFSNYALHWINDTACVANNIWRLLKPATGVLACDRLYLGDLNEVCETQEDKDKLASCCPYPSEPEFFDSWLFSLRKSGFGNFNITYYEPTSWFVEKFYRDDFSRIPLRWYHQYLTPKVTQDDCFQEWLKQLFLKHRYLQVITDEQGVERAQIKQRLWTFVAVKA